MLFRSTIASTPTVLDTGSVALNPGDTRTLVATRSGGSVAARATVDATRPISGRAQLQIVNAAPSVGSGLNSYLVKAGATIGTTTAAAVDQPVLAFATAVAAGGTYDVVFSLATDPTAPIAGPDALLVVDGGIYTIYAADAAGGGAPYRIVVDDN